MYIKHISQMYFLIEYTSAEHLVLSTLKKIIGWVLSTGFRRLMRYNPK